MIGKLPLIIEEQLDHALTNFDSEQLNISLQSFSDHIICFRRIFLAAQKKFTKQLALQFNAIGVLSLKDPNMWAEFEWAIVHSQNIKLPHPLRTVVHIYRATSNEPTANSPSTLCWGDSRSPISFFYRISGQFVIELAQAHQKLIRDKGLPLFWPRGLPRGEHTEPLAISGLKKLISTNPEAVSALKEYGLAAFIHHPILADELANVHNRPERAATQNFLRQFVDVNLFAAKEITLTYGDPINGTRKIRLDKEFSLCPEFYEDLRKYVTYLNKHGDGTSTDINQLHSKFHGTKATLTKLLEQHKEGLLAGLTKVATTDFYQTTNNNSERSCTRKVLTVALRNWSILFFGQFRTKLYPTIMN